MSEHLTHIAVYEDLVRIYERTPQICSAFKSCLQKQYDTGLIGSGTRGNHKFSIPIMKMYKDQWEEVKDDPEVQTQLAYAIGWLTHRAADRRLKLVFAENEENSNPMYTNDGCRIYQDAMTFKMVYAGGTKSCKSEHTKLTSAIYDDHMHTHSGADMIDVAIAEPLFTRLWQADMLEKQSFVQSEDDFSAWVDMFVERYQYMTEDIRRYVEAYHRPDPVLVQKYFVEDNYYDENDDIIVFVRNVQDGIEPNVDLVIAVEKAKNQSLYAQVLRQGYLYMMGASDFFVGKIDEEALWKILDKTIS